MAGPFGLFGAKAPMPIDQSGNQSMLGMPDPRNMSWGDRLYLLGAGLKDASPASPGGNLDAARQQMMQMAMYRRNMGMMDQFMQGDEQPQQAPGVPQLAQPQGALGMPSALPADGAQGAPQAPQAAPAAGYAHIGLGNRQRRALAGMAMMAGKYGDANTIMSGDVAQAADGSFYDKHTGAITGKGALAPDMASDNGLFYDKHDSAMAGVQNPKPPIDGAMAVYGPQGIHGGPIGFRLPGDRSNRIYSPDELTAQQAGAVSGAQEAAKAPYGKPELFNLPGGPRYVSPAEYPTAFGGGGQPAAPSPQGVPQAAGSMRDLVISEAQRQGVDPNLALSVMSKESGGQHYGPNGQVLTSPKGALGVMQLMPGTAKEMGVDPTDPAQNVRGGVGYLKRQLDTFHDPRLAMAAYNAGPGAVQRHGGVPPYAETQAYVGQQPGVPASSPGVQAATARQFTSEKRPDLKLPMGVYEQSPDGTVKPVQLPNADEQKRLEGLQSAATQAAEFAQMERQFLDRNANEPTGIGYVGGDHNPIRQWKVHNNTNVGAMEALENQLLFKAKPDNVGQRILQSELPIWRGSTVALDNTYDVNAGIHGDHVKQAQIVNQKAQFYNQWWAEHHGLQGADQAWDHVMQRQGMGPHETQGQQRQAPQVPRQPPQRQQSPPAGATRTATGPNGQKAYLVNGKWVTQ